MVKFKNISFKIRNLTKCQLSKLPFIIIVEPLISAIRTKIRRKPKKHTKKLELEQKKEHYTENITAYKDLQRIFPGKYCQIIRINDRFTKMPDIKRASCISLYQ